MKLESGFMVVLFIVLLVAICTVIIVDLGTHYPESGINAVNNNLSFSKNYVSLINGSFMGISDDINALATEESGWSRVLGGLIVFAKASISTMIAVILAPGYLVEMILSLAGNFDMAGSPIIPIVITMVWGSIIFVIVKFLNKSPQV